MQGGRCAVYNKSTGNIETVSSNEKIPVNQKLCRFGAKMNVYCNFGKTEKKSGIAFSLVGGAMSFYY